MSKHYYLNDKAWAYCTNGTMPNKMKVVNKLRKVKNNGLILLNEEDRFSPFSCKFMILAMAALAAFVAALSFLAAVIIGFLLGIGMCAIFTYKSKWIDYHSTVIVEGKKAVTTKSYINCYLGGKIQPTLSPAHAFSHAGLTLGQTVLEAFLINKGLKFLKPLFAQHGIKAGLGLFATNFVFNAIIDRIITKNATKTSNNYLGEQIWGIKSAENEPTNYVEEGKDVMNYSSDDNGENTRKMDDFRKTNENFESSRSNEGDRVRQTEIDRSHSEADRNYNKEIQRENTKINQDQKTARQEYKKLYREQAKREGLTGRAVDREASRQARQSAARDAAIRKQEAKANAEVRRQSAIQQGQARANQMSDDYKRNNPARTTLAQSLLNSALKSIFIGVITDVAFAQGHNAIDYFLNDQADQAKKLGINAVAIEQ